MAAAVEPTVEWVAHGRTWELVRYEWNPATGAADFAYVHRRTGERVEFSDVQPHYADARRVVGQ